MPDIAMCMTLTCPKRATCHRYRAVPNGHRQNYQSFHPHSEGSPCDGFSEVREGDHLVPTEQVDQQVRVAGTVGP